MSTQRRRKMNYIRPTALVQEKAEYFLLGGEKMIKRLLLAAAVAWLVLTGATAQAEEKEITIGFLSGAARSKECGNGEQPATILPNSLGGL